MNGSCGLTHSGDGIDRTEHFCTETDCCRNSWQLLRASISSDFAWVGNHAVWDLDPVNFNGITSTTILEIGKSSASDSLNFWGFVY